MGKKMKLIPFLFKPTEQLLSSSSSSSWPWPNCGNPKTLSFRAEKIMNSVFVTNESSYINSSVCESSSILSTVVLEEEDYSGEGTDQTIENVIRGAKTSSERLFFDSHAGETTSCLLADQHQLAKTNNKSIINTSTATNRNDCITSNDSYKYCSADKVLLMEMDSRDPYEDFKKSMEEMVEANGFNVKDDWESLHQLLRWYLEVNGKSNHGYIVGAFVDLLVSLEYSSASSSFSSPTSSSSSSSGYDDHNNSSSSSATVITQSPVSALSFSSNYSTGPCLLTLFEEEEDEEEEEDAAALDHRQSS